MALLKFLKGNYSSLSSAAIAEGQVLICGDTGEMFVDVAADKRVKIGDYVTVASLEALLAIDPASVPATRLYYVEGANILARSNGASWDQINKDTGATSIEVVGEGNAVTAAAYDAVTRKLTLTKGETFATKAALDDLDAFVGDIPEGYTETNIVAYINKKAEETLNSASGGSSESAASVLAALNTYKSENDAKVTANATAAKNAQDAADKAQTAVDTLSETHAADKKTLEDAIALKANAADVYTQTQVDGMVDDLEAADLAINNKIGEVAEGKTVVEMIAEAQTASAYDDTEVRGLIDTNAQAIAQEKTDREGAVADLKEELEGAIATKVEQSVYDAKVAELVAEDARLAGLIGDNVTAVEGVKTTVDTLVGEDTGKSVRTIANEELAAQLIAENAAESLDTLQEIAAWIQDHPNSASAMNAAIEALQAKVDTGDQTVSAYVTAAINALNIGDYATAEALAAAIERIAALETASATHATKDELKVVSDDLDAYKTAHNTDYDNAAVDAKVKTIQDQINALGDTYATDAEVAAAINAEVERANGAYATQANLTTHVDNADIHVTAADKTAWNKVVTDLADHKTAYDTKVAALESADTAIRGEFAAADTALKTELQGVIDTHANNADIHVTADDKAKWNAAQANAEKTANDALIEALSWQDF